MHVRCQSSAWSAVFLACDQLVLTYQMSRTMPSELMALVDKVAVHARAVMGAVRQRKGRLDVRQMEHVLPLTTKGRSFLPSEYAAPTDPRGTAHSANQKAATRRWARTYGASMARPTSLKASFIGFPLSRRRRWSFVRVSRSCFRTAFSHHNRVRSVRRSSAPTVALLTEIQRQRRGPNAQMLRNIQPRPAARQRQSYRVTPKLRHRSVPVLHRTGPCSPVGALHFSRASPLGDEAKLAPPTNTVRSVVQDGRQQS